MMRKNCEDCDDVKSKKVESAVSDVVVEIMKRLSLNEKSPSTPTAKECPRLAILSARRNGAIKRKLSNAKAQSEKLCKRQMLIRSLLRFLPLAVEVEIKFAKRRVSHEEGKSKSNSTLEDFKVKSPKRVNFRFLDEFNEMLLEI